MIMLKSFGVGFIVFMAASFIFYLTDGDASTDKIAFGIGFVAAAVAFLRFKPPAAIVAETVSSYHSAIEAMEEKLNADNPALYAAAEKEILENKVDPGLWSQALVKAGGKEELRKVEYMKLRVKQLKKNRQ